MTSLQERVARGMALLDERCPGWMQRIRLETLDIEDPRDCLLGQVYGQFGNGSHILFESIVAYSVDMAYGFAADDGLDGERLTDAWKEAIQHRLEHLS